MFRQVNGRSWRRLRGPGADRLGTLRQPIAAGPLAPASTPMATRPLSAVFRPHPYDLLAEVWRLARGRRGQQLPDDGCVRTAGKYSDRSVIRRTRTDFEGRHATPDLARSGARVRPASCYGSEGWGFESLRLRTGQRPVPIIGAGLLLTPLLTATVLRRLDPVGEDVRGFHKLFVDHVCVDPERDGRVRVTEPGQSPHGRRPIGLEARQNRTAVFELCGKRCGFRRSSASRAVAGMPSFWPGDSISTANGTGAWHGSSANRSAISSRPAGPSPGHHPRTQ